MFRWGKDPHVSYLYAIELDGVYVAHFSEVTGLSGQNEVFEVKEGGLSQMVHKFVTRCSYGDITLKRGYANDPLLFYWFEQSAIESKTYRMNGSIIMLSRNGQELCRFNFYRAIPVKWEGPTFNASSSAGAMQSLTIAVEELELLFPGETPNPPEPPPEPPPTPPPTPPPSTLEGVEFDVNKADIRPGSDETAVDNWGEYLNENEAKPPIFVTGHTSTTGSAGHNKSLSQSRAETVKQGLIDRGATNPITAIGYGEERLKVPTGDGVENQANRRVEIYENTNPYDGGGNPWA